LNVLERLPIRHQRSSERGEFVIERDGVRVGELTYKLAGSRMTILHTEAAASLRGGGAARKLVDAAMVWARAENLKVASRCSYASALLDRAPRYADVLAD
jgi:predicted GNAT family acetyltransferase